MVGLARLELATTGLGNRCSIHLSYSPDYFEFITVPRIVLLAVPKFARSHQDLRRRALVHRLDILHQCEKTFCERRMDVHGAL